MTSMEIPDLDNLADHVARYENTAAGNDQVHAAFTQWTDANPLPKRHRDWVEANDWGYGDRAFHYLWWLIVNDLGKRFEAPNGLEIGVFMGQTISLWALIAHELDIELEFARISPFEGNARPQHWVRDDRIAPMRHWS